MENLMPNVYTYADLLLKAVRDTLLMVAKSGFYGLVIGLFLGVLLVVTKKDGIMQNRFIYRLLDSSTNILRSIPFVILVPTLIPITRIFGPAVGIKGATFPLVVGCVLFFMRQVELALSDIDPGLVEAAQSMGVSPIGIVLRVYLRESIPALVRSTSITIVSLIGLTAMAGSIGGGGLGDFVIRYGHNRFMYDITVVSVIIILIMVLVVQGLGNYIIRKTTHR